MKPISAERIPARTLADIDVPDGAYKPDFELTDRFQAFATELLRLALLGIAGYGFLISEVIMKLRLASSNAPSGEHRLVASSDAKILVVGIVALGAAAGFALVYRLRSTNCLGRQLAIARTLKRMDQPHWDVREREVNEARLASDRAQQGRILTWCHRYLVAGVVCLAIGTAAVVWVLVSTLARAV
jgi:hypothetical protein